MPLCSFAGSVWAKTSARFETEPLLIHVFRPRSTHASPSRRAEARILVARARRDLPIREVFRELPDLLLLACEVEVHRRESIEASVRPSVASRASDEGRDDSLRSRPCRVAALARPPRQA